MIRKTLLVLALVVGALPVWSQVATGLYNYGSFDSFGFDSIDRGSLNVHFSIPVVNKSGRGLPFQYTLVYDGLVWAPTVSGGVTTWTISSSFGLQGYLLNEGYKGYLSYSQISQTCGRGGNTTYQNADYTYHDQFGVSHYFNYRSDVCKYGIVGDGSTNDGSGYSFNGTNVIARNGATLTLPVYLNGSAQSLNANISDANGNQVTNNQNGTFTDTTGANVLSITGNGTAASPKVFSYLTYGTNPNNTNPPSASVKITYKTYQVETAFGCSGVGEYNLSADLPDRITLADTSFYQFTYELTPGQQQGGTNVTGRLASIRAGRCPMATQEPTTASIARTARQQV